MLPSPFSSHSSSCKDGTSEPPLGNAARLLLHSLPAQHLATGQNIPIHHCTASHIPQNRLPSPPLSMPSPGTADADLPISVIPHDLLSLPPTSRRRRRAGDHTRHPRTCSVRSSRSCCSHPCASSSWGSLRYGRSGDIAKHILAGSSACACAGTGSARSWYGEARVRMPTTTTSRTSDGRRRRQAEAARPARARR